MRTRGLWWRIARAQVAMFVQVILGILTVKLGKLEFTQSHALNGFAGMIAIAVIYLNLTQRKDMTYLLYGIGSLFIMGLGKVPRSD